MQVQAVSLRLRDDAFNGFSSPARSAVIRPSDHREHASASRHSQSPGWSAWLCWRRHAGARRRVRWRSSARPTQRQTGARSPSPAACAPTGCRTTPTPPAAGLVKESPQQLGVSSSRFQSASSECNHLLPNGGSGPEPRSGAAGQGPVAGVLPVRAQPRRPELPRPRAATAAYPTLPPLESIRVRRSSRPQTKPAGSTGRPTCPRMPPTTPTPGHRGDERDELDAKPGISRSVKQVLSFGCGLLRLRCSTRGVALTSTWP